MNDQTPDALICSTSEGHASIAAVLRESVSDLGFHAQEAKFIDPIMSIYRWAYREAPWFCRYYYHLVNQPWAPAVAYWYSAQTHRPSFTESVKKFPPKIILSSSFGFEPLIAAYKQANQIPYINVVVDPRTFFRPNVSLSANYNCVFDEESAERVHRVLPTAKTFVTGWFLRSQFYKEFDRQKMRASLHLDPQILTFLFVTGSEGQTAATHLIQELKKTTKPIQVLLACGTNTQLLEKMTQLQLELQRSHSKLALHPFSFTTELEKYMAAADLVLGKAGPNSIFESATVGTPFMALSHVAGQEDGNLALIQQYNLGYVAEESSVAKKVIESIIAEPMQLQQFGLSMKKIRQYNADAKIKLQSKIKELT